MHENGWHRILLSGVNLSIAMAGMQMHGSFSWPDACHLGTTLNTWTPTTRDVDPLLDANDPSARVHTEDTILDNPFLYPITHIGSSATSPDWYRADLLRGRVTPTSRDDGISTPDGADNPPNDARSSPGEGHATGDSSPRPIAMRLPVPTGVVCAINPHGTHYFVTDQQGTIRSCRWGRNAALSAKLQTAKCLIKWLVLTSNTEEHLGRGCGARDNGHCAATIDVSGMTEKEDRWIFTHASELDR